MPSVCVYCSRQESHPVFVRYLTENAHDNTRPKDPSYPSPRRTAVCIKIPQSPMLKFEMLIEMLRRCTGTANVTGARIFTCRLLRSKYACAGASWLAICWHKGSRQGLKTGCVKSIELFKIWRHGLVFVCFARLAPAPLPIVLADASPSALLALAPSPSVLADA